MADQQIDLDKRLRRPDAAANRPGVVKPRLIFGLTLIAIGIAFTLDRMGYFNAENLWDYWSVVLIAAGVSKLTWPAGSSGRLSGWILVAIGAWILLNNIGLVAMDFWNWWPLFLIVVGVWLMFSKQQPVSAASRQTVNAVAMLGGISLTNSTSDFRGGDLAAFMGGCEIDLRAAQITNSPAVIDAFAFWGGVEIKVPEHWRVVVNGIPILGAYEDNTRLPDVRDGLPAPELVVKGFVIMGGVEIKN